MSEDQPRESSAGQITGGDNCFACSPTNPIGLKITFSLQDDVCIGRFTPEPNHVGYDNVVHGGLLFTALDDVMANWLNLRSLFGFTAKASVRYRQPAQIGQTLRLEGRCVHHKGRIYRMQGQALVDATNVSVCEAEATFMLSR